MGLPAFFKKFGLKHDTPSPLRDWEIKSDLRKCCEMGLEALISVDGSETSYKSAFIDLDTENRLILVNVPDTDLGVKAIRKSRLLKLSYKFEGTTCSFVSSFKELDSGADACIKISMPTQIDNGQKRQFFRVEPHPDRPIAITIKKDQDSVEIKERIRDICEGGVCFALPPGQRGNLKIGTCFDSLTFDLPEIGPVTTKGVIKNIADCCHHKNMCCTEFIDVSVNAMDKIYKYVVHRQQEDEQEAKKESRPEP